ncbi:DNA methyltransferase [Gemmobacter lanyuensis]
MQDADHQNLLDITEKERTSVLPWKGQFSPQLVEFLISRYSAPNKTILDPFCGSGTVLYEAAQMGCGAIGLDINPAAVALAQIAKLCNAESSDRFQLVEVIKRTRIDAAKMLSGEVSTLQLTSLVSELVAEGEDEVSKIVKTAYLMLAFGDGSSTDLKKLNRASSMLCEAVVRLPKSSMHIEARIGDARATDLPSRSIDYVLTSPPYINVFNYHQNYRQITEALGEKPLSAARAEIGANRKFRQNRFMTVVQYCMDISAMFCEMGRLLKPGSPLTIILGRESSVRSVPFKNGELISAIAIEGMSFKPIEWNERKFLNRYGAIIYEDVITMQPCEVDLSEAVEIGRAVGAQALRNSLSYCEAERVAEIKEAVSAASKIELSPFVLEERLG